MPKIPASERDAFYEKRRAELVEAALALWAERGFDQGSVAAIAEAAGVSKGTFYLYFESKDALLEEVFRRNSLVPRVVQLVEDLQHGTLDDAVRGFVRAAWRHLSEHRELVLMALREIPTQLDRARVIFERVMVPLNAAIAVHLEERLGPERSRALSLPIAVRSLVGSVVFVFLTQEVLGASKAFPVPEDEVTDTIAELFLNGVVRA